MGTPRRIIEDTQIDKFALEDECANQASIFRYWSRKAVDAKAERDLIKKKLDALESSLQIKIASGAYALPTDKDGKPIKLTAPVVKAIIEVDADVQVLKTELIEEERKAGKAASNEKSMEHKRSSLNNEVTLFNKEYYADANTGKKPSSVKGDMAGDAQREGLNKRKKKES